MQTVWSTLRARWEATEPQLLMGALVAVSSLSSLSSLSSPVNGSPGVAIPAQENSDRFATGSRDWHGRSWEERGAHARPA